MAISAKYRKTLINRQFIIDEASATASDIYKLQTTIAKTHSGSGHLSRFLSTKPFTVNARGSGVILTLNYPLAIRYMDMKKDKYGKIKKHYDPIYNKIVWGYIYGYLYRRLIYGISRDMNQAIVQRLETAGYKFANS